MRVLSYICSIAIFSNSLFAAEAVKPEDLNAFLYTLDLRDFGNENRQSRIESPLGKRAEQELIARNIKPEDLYIKFQEKLTELEPSLLKLFALHRAKEEGQSKTTYQCLEFGLCLIFLAGIASYFQIGIEKSANGIKPVIGFRISPAASPDRPTGIGAFLEMGFHSEDLENSDGVIHQLNDEAHSGETQHGAAGVGAYKLNTKSSKSGGLALGIGFSLSDNSDSGYKMSLPTLYRYSFPHAEINQKLIAIMRALYVFDFNQASLLIEEFKIYVSKLENLMKERGLKITDRHYEKLSLIEHPLKSVGRLFSIPVLQMYFPQLLPESLRENLCDLVLLPGEKAKPKSKKTAPLLTFGN